MNTHPFSELRDEMTQRRKAETLLAERKKRASKFPAPAWGDHVLHGVRRLTRGSYILNSERLRALGL